MYKKRDAFKASPQLVTIFKINFIRSQESGIRNQESGVG